MPFLSLQHPYPSVAKENQLSYGGCQSWLADPVAQKSGCGLVAAADLLIYLHRCSHHPADFFRALPPDPIPAEIYNNFAHRLRKRYFPLAASFGLNAFLLAFGMNRFLYDNHLPYKAQWGVTGKNLWPAVRSMLQRDIPVILCVGVNFPFPWGKEQLPFHSLVDGQYRPTTAAHAHYVTVTGMDDHWLRVSSWGREYFLSQEQYRQFRKDHSCGLYSNILYLR